MAHKLKKIFTLIEECENNDDQILKLHQLLINKRSLLSREFIGTTLVTVIILCYVLTREFFDVTELNLILIRFPQNEYTDAIALAALSFFNYRLFRLAAELKYSDDLLDKLNDKIFDRIGGSVLTHYMTPFTTLRSLFNIPSIDSRLAALTGLFVRLPFLIFLLTPLVAQVFWMRQLNQEGLEPYSLIWISILFGIYFLALIFWSLWDNLWTLIGSSLNNIRQERANEKTQASSGSPSQDKTKE